MTTEFAKVENYFSIARCPHGAVNLIKKLCGAAVYAARLTSLVSVCNQISESGSAPSFDKILLLRMELMLNTGTKYLGMAFILKTMPKLDHLGVLF